MDWVFFGVSVAFAFIASINTFTVMHDLLADDIPWARVAWNTAASLAGWAVSLFCLMAATATAFNLVEVGSKQ